MNFDFYCWACGVLNVLEADDVGVWGERWALPSEWRCWHCAAMNTTPDD